MKKLSIFLFVLTAMVGLNSCSSEDDVVFTVQPDPEGINFINTFNETYVLTAATRTNIAERFVWNTVDFGVPTNITYELQGSADANFESFDVLGTSQNNNLGVRVSQLMALAMDAGLDTDPESDAPNMGQLYFRVLAYAGNNGGNSNAQTSEVKSITVMLPEDAVEGEVPLKNLFLVGNATAAGWNNNNNNTPLFRDATNPDVYNFTGKFTAGEFKLLEERGAWQPQWGLENGALTSSEILGGDPGTFNVSSDGYYVLTLNSDELTYTFTPFDASTAPTFPTIGVLGDAAGGWETDKDFTKSEFDPHLWYILGIELEDGEIKFRANDSWDINWGGDTAMSGLATQNGPNIPVTAGTYDIWFNNITKRYILIPVETAE